MKVLLLNDAAASANWGGRAASIPLRMMIEQAGGEIVSIITIDDLGASSLDPAPQSGADGRDVREGVKQFLPPIVLTARRRVLGMVQARRRDEPIPATWDDYDRCLRQVLGSNTPWPRLLKTIEDIDLAVINGDGDIAGTFVVPRTLLFLAYLIKKRFGKPVIMIDHSADLGHPDLRRVAEHVYPLFDDVTFRDLQSLEQCDALCSGRFAADTAFWFSPCDRTQWAAVAGRPTYHDVWPDSAAFDPARGYVCLGGSSIFHEAVDRPRVLEGYVSLVRRLRSTYDGQVVLTASDPLDQPFFRALAERCALPLLATATPLQQAVDVLGNADAYIGGRWHPSIFALRGGAPVVALSSQTFKMRALMEMAGLPVMAFDALKLDDEAGAICDHLTRLLQQTDLRDRLRSWGATWSK